MKAIVFTFLFLIAYASGAADRGPHQEPAGSGQAAPGFAQDEHGFRQQFQAAFDAFRAGDATAGIKLLEQFRIPNAEVWFSEHFETAVAASLAERYRRTCDDFIASTAKTMQDLANKPASSLVIHARPEPSGPPRVPSHFKLSTVSPLQPLLFNRFGFELEGGGVKSTWERTFLYNEGAFRFVGGGAYPFWIWEEGAAPGFSHGGEAVERPILVHSAPPDYPIATERQNVEGTVRLRAIIGRDGNVKTVTVLDGDPLLVDAAIAAVRQWKYKPALLGGKPTELDTIINVVFRLPHH
jgi:TonB family protein